MDVRIHHLTFLYICPPTTCVSESTPCCSTARLAPLVHCSSSPCPHSHTHALSAFSEIAMVARSLSLSHSLSLSKPHHLFVCVIIHRDSDPILVWGPTSHYECDCEWTAEKRHLTFLYVCPPCPNTSPSVTGAGIAVHTNPCERLSVRSCGACRPAPVFAPTPCASVTVCDHPTPCASVTVCDAILGVEYVFTYAWNAAT